MLLFAGVLGFGYMSQSNALYMFASEEKAKEDALSTLQEDKETDFQDEQVLTASTNVKNATTFVKEDFEYEINTYAVSEEGAVDWDYYTDTLSEESLAKLMIESGVILKGLSDSGKAKVAANGGVLNIPETIDGQVITVIDNRAFDGETLTSLTMPDTIKCIGVGAFRNNDLQSVTLPASLLFLNEMAFNNNTSIKTMEFPSELIELGGYNFEENNALETVKMGGKIEILGEYAFYNCRNLGKNSPTLTIPGSAKQIWNGTFVNTAYNFVNIEEGVESLQAIWFHTLTGLKVVNIPESVKTADYRVWSKMFYNTPNFAIVNKSNVPIRVPSTVTDYEWSKDRMHEAPVIFDEVNTGKDYAEFTGSLYAKYDNLAVKLEDGITFADGSDELYALSLMTKDEFKAFLNEEENIPVKEGYDFVGWDTSGFDTGNNQASWETLPIPSNGAESGVYLVDHVLGITPIFEKKVTLFNVTFKDWDGTVLDEQTVAEGEAAIAPEDPTRENYKFIGWDIDFSKVSADMSVTARYEKETTEKIPETGQNPYTLYRYAILALISGLGMTFGFLKIRKMNKS